jgi:ADP-heptose:LPS heptosyltransferase
MGNSENMSGEQTRSTRKVNLKTTGDSGWRPYRILVCRPNSRLGNTLLLTPLLQELEARFPSAEVDLLTSCPAAGEIFREFSCVRTIHQLPRLGVRHPIEQVLTYLRARRTRYDLIIDPCLKSRSARFALRFLRGDVKIGFWRSHKSRGTDISLPVTEATTHMGSYPVQLLRRTVLNGHCGESEFDIPRLTIHLTAAERRYGRNKLRQLIGEASTGRPVVAVNLVATGAKQLPVEWWHEMRATLTACNPGIRIIEILPASGVAQFRDYPGYFSTDVRRVAAVIAAADCFVSADGGLMHLGTATNTTTIGLFNVTDPAVYAPYGGANAAIHVTHTSPDIVARQIARLSMLTQLRPPRPNRRLQLAKVSVSPRIPEREQAS